MEKPVNQFGYELVNWSAQVAILLLVAGQNVDSK